MKPGALDIKVTVGTLRNRFRKDRDASPEADKHTWDGISFKSWARDNSAGLVEKYGEREYSDAAMKILGIA